MIVSELKEVTSVKLGEIDVSKVMVGESQAYPDSTEKHFYIFHESNNTVTEHVLSDNQTSDSFVDLVAQGNTYYGYNKTVLDYSDVQGKTGIEILALYGTIASTSYQTVVSELEENKVYMVFEQNVVYINSLAAVDAGSSVYRFCGVFKDSFAKNGKMVVNGTEVSCGKLGTVGGKTPTEVFGFGERFICNTTTTINNNTTYTIVVKMTTKDNIVITGSTKTAVVDGNGNITIT